MYYPKFQAGILCTILGHILVYSGQNLDRGPGFGLCRTLADFRGRGGRGCGVPVLGQYVPKAGTLRKDTIRTAEYRLLV